MTVRTAISLIVVFVSSGTLFKLVLIFGVPSGTLINNFHKLERSIHPPVSLSPMELSYLGNKYVPSDERPVVKPHAQLKYMGKAYYSYWTDKAKSEASLTYRGIAYSR